MTRTRKPRTAATSRRRFLKTVAMGSAAAVVAATLPHAGAAAPAPSKGAPKAKPVTSARPAATEAEIARQKQATADMLKTIRDFELPAGSEPAFAFSAVKASKRTPTPGATPASGGAR
jgi:hypothetical protein